MRKLLGMLSVLVLASLVLGTVPVFGGWSWCGSDPIFVITGEDGQQVTVNADIVLALAGDPLEFDGSRVQVTLEVPKGEAVELVDAGGFKVKVKVKSDDKLDGEARLEIRGREQCGEDYYLHDVGVTLGGSTTVSPDQEDMCEWVFRFGVP